MCLAGAMQSGQAHSFPQYCRLSDRKPVNRLLISKHVPLKF
jgi:hypothetical protein